MENENKFVKFAEEALKDWPADIRAGIVGKVKRKSEDTMKAQLIVEITPDGIVVTGCENIPVPNYSVEQQAMNPLLGVGYAGRSINEAFRFITQVAEKVCHE